MKHCAEWHDIGTSYIGRSPKYPRFQFPTISNNNMADARIYEAVSTQPSLTVVMGFGILFVAFSDVFMMYMLRETYCSAVRSKICFIVGLSVSGYGDKLTLNVGRIIHGNE